MATKMFATSEPVVHPSPTLVVHPPPSPNLATGGIRYPGWQDWIQSGSDGTQMGQIRDFFRSDFRTFWRPAPKCPEI